MAIGAVVRAAAGDPGTFALLRDRATTDEDAEVSAGRGRAAG